MRDASRQGDFQVAPLQLLSCVLIISFGSVPQFPDQSWSGAITASLGEGWTIRQTKQHELLHKRPCVWFTVDTSPIHLSISYSGFHSHIKETHNNSCFVCLSWGYNPSFLAENNGAGEPWRCLSSQPLHTRATEYHCELKVAVQWGQ